MGTTKEIMTVKAKVFFLFAILTISLHNHLKVSALNCYNCEDDGLELCEKEIECPIGACVEEKHYDKTVDIKVPFKVIKYCNKDFNGTNCLEPQTEKKDYIKYCWCDKDLCNDGFSGAMGIKLPHFLIWLIIVNVLPSV